MKNIILATILLFGLQLKALSQNHIYSPNIKTLQVVVNNDWLSPPVMTLGSHDVLNISFDELSHTYNRFVYKIEHCEADWSPSEEIFESDYLVGFNNNPIEDYQNSINTTVQYTHYKLQIPNERCQLKMSGNYKLSIYNEDNNNEKVIEARFMICEPLIRLGLSATSNTDIDTNKSHQQVEMHIVCNGLNITNIDEQIHTVVRQNNRTDNQKTNIKPNIINSRELKWTHNRQLIFEAGNEFRKFEVLATSHATMGINEISWDGQYFNAYPFICEPRLNYTYDEDANGAFYIRNSDNFENDITSDYILIHYNLKAPYTDNIIEINGNWTNEDERDGYVMKYDKADGSYKTTIMQKQGYYSFQFLQQSENKKEFIHTEGNFYQTENKYQAYVYFKEIGGRTWRLIGYKQYQFDSSKRH